MNKIVSDLHAINYGERLVKKQYKKPERIKAFVITMLNDSYSSFLSRVCTNTIEESGSHIDYSIFPATIPETIERDLSKITSIKNPESLAWTWPIDSKQDGYCLKTGLYKRTYKANDQRKVIACMVSHMKLWQMCIDLDQPIMILEHDAAFKVRFYMDLIKKDFTGGILGLNNPRGATRKASIFFEEVKSAEENKSIITVPSVDKIGDLPLPQGLAGNSAYIIKPWAAKELLDKVSEIGMWPNDALMCKQLFPWIQVTTNFYTEITQTKKSSTTG